MKNNPNKLWAIHFVDNEAKDRAKKLAKANKQKIGVWLTKLILNDSPDKNVTIELEGIHRKLDEINKMLCNIRIDQPIPRPKTILNKIFG